MSVTRAYRGAASGAGVVPLEPTGLPAHLRPGASKAGVGNSLVDDQRVAALPHVFIGDAGKASLAVQIANTATVAFQGCNGDPSVAGEWFDLATALTSSGVMVATAVARFARANVTAHTSGAVGVQLTATSA
jgi:hypothetical protein